MMGDGSSFSSASLQAPPPPENSPGGLCQAPTLTLGTQKKSELRVFWFHHFHPLSTSHQILCKYVRDAPQDWHNCTVVTVLPKHSKTIEFPFVFSLHDSSRLSIFIMIPLEFDVFRCVSLCSRVSSWGRQRLQHRELCWPQLQRCLQTLNTRDTVGYRGTPPISIAR